jgi:AraC-like DNA-binding protein
MATTRADRIPISPTLRARFLGAGLDFPALLREAGLELEQFLAPGHTLRTAEFFAVFHAAERLGGGDVGVRLAVRDDVGSLAARAMLCAPTLGEGLSRLARYKRIICPEEITVSIAGGEARIRLEWLLAETEPPVALVDSVFAGMLALARQGTGTELRPVRVELARARAHHATLRRHFGCEVVFDAPIDQLVFAASSLALPMVTANPDLLASVDPQLERALKATGARTLLDSVRLALCRSMTGARPSIGRVARELGLSARTLQRRLREEGASYQGLLDEVRLRTARRLLSRTSLRAEEIAFMLGFDEFNSFTRAFRTWQGVSPNGWRGRRPARSSPTEAVP